MEKKAAAALTDVEGLHAPVEQELAGHHHARELPGTAPG
jgi:hypothetical protein